MVRYFDGGKLAEFNGVMFCRDDKTGYYLNSNTRTRLHRAVWEYHNGEIPDGYEIHHIDRDKSNNEPGNLAMLTREQHHKIHVDEMTDDLRERLRKNLDETARPKASEWHGSNSGREWHKIHYERMKEKLYKRRVFTCANCGKEFETVDHGTNKFCSGACRAAYRRKSGVDNEKRVCCVCGNEYEANKYSKSRTCSRECSGLLRWGQKRQESGMRACV